MSVTGHKQNPILAPKEIAPIEVRVITNPKLLYEIYRFRYDIYVVGVGRDKAAADHEKRILTDWRDETATVLGAYQDGILLGSGRINFSSQGSLGDEELFGFSEYEKRLPGALSLTSKLIVSPEARGTRVYLELARAFCLLALKNGSVLNFIITDDHLKPLFEKLGFRKYRDAREWLDYGLMNPMSLDFRDLNHLKKVRSPFIDLIGERSEPKSKVISIKEKTL